MDRRKDGISQILNYMDPEISKFKPRFYENRLLIDFKGTVENFNGCFT